MKTQIKFGIIILAVMILLSSFPVYAQPDSTVDKNTATELQRISNEFLTKRAKNEWLYENNDLSVYLKPISTLGTASSGMQYSVPLQTFLDMITLLRSHRIFVGTVQSDFNVSHDFISMVKDEEKIILTIREELTYMIENGNNLPTYIEEVYKLSFINDGETWLIDDIDVLNDPFYTTYKETGFNYQEVSTGMRNFVMELNPRMEAELAVVSSDISNRATSSVPYNRDVAAAYALVYSGSTDSYYNGNFFNYSSWGGDCANFASQCVWAGFGGDNSRANSLVYPQDKTGDGWYHWYSLKNGDHTDMWTGAETIGSYADYMKTSSSTENGWLANTYTGVQYSSLPSNVNFKGCVFLVIGANGGDYQHAIFINDATVNSPTSIRYCAHTGNVRNALLSTSTYTAYRIKIVEPTMYRRYNSSCTGHSYTSYSSGSGFDATCNNCGESRMLFTLGWGYGEDSVPKNITLSEKNGRSCYRIVVKIKNSSGVTLSNGTFTVANVSSFSCNYTFANDGLYTIEVNVWDSYATYTSSPDDPEVYTFAVRIW